MIHASHLVRTPNNSSATRRDFESFRSCIGKGGHSTSSSAEGGFHSVTACVWRGQLFQRRVHHMSVVAAAECFQVAHEVRVVTNVRMTRRNSATYHRFLRKKSLVPSYFESLQSLHISSCGGSPGRFESACARDASWRGQHGTRHQ